MRVTTFLILASLAAGAMADSQGARRTNPLEEIKRALSPVKRKPKGQVCATGFPRFDAPAWTR